MSRFSIPAITWRPIVTAACRFPSPMGAAAVILGLCLAAPNSRAAADPTPQTPRLRIRDVSVLEGDDGGTTNARLTLSDPVGASLDEARAVGTILDDDYVPTVKVEDATVVEGDWDPSPVMGRASVTDNIATGVIVNNDHFKAQFTLVYDGFPLYTDGILAPAWGDYDRDGRPDLPLYHNDGPAWFSEIPGFRALLGEGNFHGSAWCDYDRDGRLDLVITGYAEVDSTRTLLLHQSSDGTFTNVAPALGLDVLGHGETAVWADFDGDGWPDLYIPYYPYVPPYRCMLYHNDGGGTFTEVGEAAGVAMIGQPAGLEAEGATATDLDGDGDIDLYAGSHLFANDGTGRFTDVRAEVGLPETFDEGAMFVDYDNDGDLDFYLRDASGPRLFRNEGGHFTEVTAAAGLPPVPEFGWGDSWADVDNDGDLDLVYFVREAPGRLMLNQGDGMFARDSSFEAQDIYVDMSCWADVDADGDLDLLAGSWPKSLYQNDLTGQPGLQDSYLRVRVLDERGDESEHGVTVRLERLDAPAGGVQTRIVGGGASYLAQNEYEAHFGVVPDGRYALAVVFPGPSGGRVVVDQAADPNLGSIEPRLLVHKTIVVYRDGRVEIDTRGTPGTAGHLGARPNPMRGSGTLTFALDRPSRVSLTAFDAGGRRVRSLAEGGYASGSHPVRWDLRDDRGAPVPTGIYFVQLRLDGRPAGFERVVVLD